MLDTRQPPPFWPNVLAPLFADVALLASTSSMASPTSLEAEMDRVANYFCKTDRQLHSSKAALSQLVQCPAQKLEPHLGVLAATLIHCDGSQRAAFEAAVSASACTLVAYVELSRFDETPVKVGQKHLLRPETHRRQTPHPSQPASATAEVRGLSDSSLARTAARLPTTDTVTKLMAVENKFLCLIYVDPHAQPESGGDAPQYICFTGSSLSHLRMLERATGQCILECLLGNSLSSPSCNHFKIKLRSATTDQAQSNLSAREGWHGLHLPCNVHIIARSFARSFDLMASDISGMVNMSLCLSFGAKLLKFPPSPAACGEVQACHTPWNSS